MLKQLMFMTALAPGFLCARADTLEEDFRRVCVCVGAESVDMTGDINLSADPSAKFDKFVMVQPTPDSVALIDREIALIPSDKLWMIVDENGQGLNLYGEEKPDGKISLIIRMCQSDETTLMYLEGNKEIAKYIQIN